MDQEESEINRNFGLMRGVGLNNANPNSILNLTQEVTQSRDVLNSSWDIATQPNLEILRLSEDHLLPRNGLNSSIGVFDTVEFTNTNSALYSINNNLPRSIDNTKYMQRDLSLTRQDNRAASKETIPKFDPFKAQNDLSQTGRFLKDLSYEKRYQGTPEYINYDEDVDLYQANPNNYQIRQNPQKSNVRSQSPLLKTNIHNGLNQLEELAAHLSFENTSKLNNQRNVKHSKKQSQPEYDNFDDEDGQNNDNYYDDSEVHAVDEPKKEIDEIEKLKEEQIKLQQKLDQILKKKQVIDKQKEQYLDRIKNFNGGQGDQQAKVKKKANIQFVKKDNFVPESDVAMNRKKGKYQKYEKDDS